MHSPLLIVLENLSAIAFVATHCNPINLLKAVRAWSGTTALPRALNRSNASGSPSSTRYKSGSIFLHSAWQDPISLLSLSVCILSSRRPDSHCCWFRSGKLLVSAARRNHLFLRCGAPTSAADTTSHRQSYLWRAKVLTTSSAPLVLIAGTFSRNIKAGLISPTSRKISETNPLRFPAKPCPSPATLMSWHGNPP